MSYFGLLKDLNLNSLTMDELTRIQLSRGILQEVTRIPLSVYGRPNAISLKNSETVYVPDPDMTEEFYGYIVDVYEDVIENSLIGFYYVYEEDIMGLDERDTRKVALEHYKRIAQLATKNEFDILRPITLPSGHLSIRRAKKIELFELRKEALQERLAAEVAVPLTHFLIGNAAYFEDSLIGKFPLLDETLKFEASLRILLTLNDQFQFETVDDTPKKIENKLPIAQQLKEKSTDRKKKDAIISDDEAIDFLLNSVFSKSSK
ncbi:hypothetical protein [Zobellia sp. 1_MG-2023]|uniref:hypothetical protein n=1 Tax=Zobellia sp. 1_MG-2023 TaxID=3062626 RepID=UPI0026E31070|nr:hypothetical protein [Zobellia sp. 1_MG-2023]MDO6821356.1 hypothetical protein [Zobellia sp. 1_MG-2023]